MNILEINHRIKLIVSNIYLLIYSIKLQLRYLFLISTAKRTDKRQSVFFTYVPFR